MAAEYDENGEYKYPEGFDPETNEWLEGFETQREAWEADYAKAHSRWESHREQVRAAAVADAEAAAEAAANGTAGAEGDDDAAATSYSSTPVAAEPQGALASDEALAALREKLTGN
jgi:small subunit ribosomal protein S1